MKKGKKRSVGTAGTVQSQRKTQIEESTQMGVDYGHH